ncbi:cytochrome P450 [Umbelopsis sp. PMI_123]|nr:cytochrome P450 [Umbelopsis sp. PMI_123]
MNIDYINSTLQVISGRVQQSYKKLSAPVVTVSAALVASYLVLKLFKSSKKRPSHVAPAVPYTIPFIGHGLEMNREPYAFIQRCKEKYGPVFEICSFGQKLIVVTGNQVVDCFRVGEEYLDFQEGVKDLLPTAHIVEVSYDKMKPQEGPQYPMNKNPVIRLVRNNFKSHQLDIFQDRMVDAIERGLDKDITFKPGENSTTLDASIFFQKVVARISAQVFAGEAYADNEPLIDALASYSLSMFRAGMVQAIFPRPIADFITRRYLSVGQNIDVTMREVAPYLSELKKQEDQFGQSKPTNFMHMMLQTPAADDHIQTPDETAFWMKDIAFASIHTTSLFLGFALHDLSDRPDIQDLLRNEIDESKAKDGELTPEIIAKLPIMDSFLRESLRLGSDYVGFRHKAMKDTVLPSGITIPKGTTVGLSVYDAHTDPELQDIGTNGIPLTELDPLRFVGRRSKKSTAVGPDLLVFGVGFHSCPGRYFASQEIRYLLACILEKYDISPTTKDGKRAPNSLALVSIFHH